MRNQNPALIAAVLTPDSTSILPARGPAISAGWDHHHASMSLVVKRLQLTLCMTAGLRKTSEKNVDPKHDWVYIRECHPLG
jgi:hypothetical protein